MYALFSRYLRRTQRGLNARYFDFNRGSARRLQARRMDKPVDVRDQGATGGETVSQPAKDLNRQPSRNPPRQGPRFAGCWSASSAQGTRWLTSCSRRWNWNMPSWLSCDERVRQCGHAGYASQRFAWGWLRGRKPVSGPGWFIARLAPWYGFTSPNTRRPLPRAGREATGLPRPKSRLPGIASRIHLPKPCRPPIGRHSD